MPKPLLVALFVSFALSPVLSPVLFAADLQGIVLPVKEVSVASPVEDIVREVVVKEGDVVAEGEPLAHMQSAKEQLEVDLYAKQMEQREFAAKGMENLLKENMVSKEVALEKTTDHDLARISWMLAQERLKDKTITAPLSGIVVKIYKEPGEGVQKTEKMFEVVNIDQVYLQFYLEPKLMPVVQPGMKVPVRFPVLGEDVEFTASVAFVDPRIDAASGLFRVKLLLDNPKHEIKAGMRGQADFDKLAARS